MIGLPNTLEISIGITVGIMITYVIISLIYIKQLEKTIERLEQEEKKMLDTKQLDIEEFNKVVQKVLETGKEMTYKQFCDELKNYEEEVKRKREIKIIMGENGEFKGIEGLPEQEFKVKKITEELQIQRNEEDEDIQKETFMENEEEGEKTYD